MELSKEFPIPPVVLIVFRRPDVTKSVIEALSLVKPQRLFVVADGPRVSSPEDLELVNATRSLIDSIGWPCEITKIYSDINLGLRRRVITGLDEVFSHVDRAIILEDDCLPSATFFPFAAELLEKYAQTSSVGLISANNFGPSTKHSNSYFFSTRASIWGWATWKRTWQGFRSSKEVADLTGEEVQEILCRIPNKGERRFFSNLIRNSHYLDSWAIQFSSFCSLNGLVCAVPMANLAMNIGFGGQSTHTKFESWVDEVPLGSMQFPLHHPPNIQPNIDLIRKEMSRKQLNWFIFPIKHPLSAIARIFRYLAIRYF